MVFEYNFSRFFKSEILLKTNGFWVLLYVFHEAREKMQVIKRKKASYLNIY